jgi:hypothetical protein
MRIKDIEVGVEYAALENPNPGRYGRSILPRKVRVEEIVTVPVTRYYGFNGKKLVDVRKVRVTVIGGEPSSRYDGKIACSHDGDVLVVETRQLVQPWTPELEDEVGGKLALRAARKAMEIALDARVGALGLDSTSVSVRVYGTQLDVELKAGGPDVEKILAAMES